MIIVAGKVNSGKSLYILHRAVEYCKKRYNPTYKERLDVKPTLWAYGELNLKDNLRRIEMLYPSETIVGEIGYLEVSSKCVPIPTSLDSIIRDSMNWKNGDVILIDCPLVNTEFKSTISIAEELEIVKFTLEALQKHTGVVMYVSQQLNRNDEIDFKTTHTHGKFEWETKNDGEILYVNLMKK